MAEAAATGAAAEPGIDVRLLQATAAGPGDVLAADGYRLGRTPAALSLLFKKTAPALVNSAFDALCDGRQHPGQLKLNPDASIFDIDESARRLSCQTHSKVEAVAGPHAPFNGD